MLYFENKYGKIYNDDTLTVLKQLPGQSVNCVITSPPYWALRDYKSEKQLGLERDFNVYINKLMEIFNEIKRILKKNGTCWVNIGDTYYTKSGTNFLNCKINKNSVIENYGLNKVNSIRGCGLLSNKTMVGIPFRFAIEMINNKWILRNTIIWQKPNIIPQSSKDRFTQDFEYVFFFVKNKKYNFNQLLEPIKNNKIEDLRYRIKRCIWTIPSMRGNGHIATFPQKLVENLILAGSNENDIILDPFIGSGTLAISCMKLKRRYIGIELKEEYCEMAKNKILENETLF